MSKNVERTLEFVKEQFLKSEYFKNHEEQLEFVNKKLENLNKYLGMPFGTKTATELWKVRVLYQLDFFSRLKEQLDNGDKVNVLGESL